MLKTFNKTLPIESEKPCDPPVALPDRRINARETTDYWDVDRAALELCEQKRAAAVQSARGPQ